MLKNIPFIAKFTSLTEPSIRRVVCAGIIGLATMVNVCFGQQIIGQDDSLVTDSVDTVTNKGVSGSTDSVAQQHATIQPHPNDSILQKNTGEPKTSTLASQRIISHYDSLTADSVHTGTVKGVVSSIDTETQHHEMSKPDIAEPTPPRKPEDESIEPAVDNLSPFSSDKMNSFGFSLDYFSYAEQTSLSDVFSDGIPQNIQGAPKSTEYGLLFGLNYQGAMRQHGSSILYRPNLEAQIGIHQTYDGSTQVEPIFDSLGRTIGYQFFPVKFYKSNYFVQAGCDVGYCRTHAILPFYIYTGIKGRLWYRDMVADTTTYSNQITNSEMYYWFSVPVGLALSIPASPNLAIGIDASCDLMFFGQMQAFLSGSDPDTSFSTNSPAVTLGNRMGYQVEVSLTYKSDNGTIFRFAPYVNVYSFGRSETETSKSYSNGSYAGTSQDFFEPSSSSWLVGMKFQVVLLSPRTRAP